MYLCINDTYSSYVYDECGCILLNRYLIKVEIGDNLLDRYNNNYLFNIYY